MELITGRGNGKNLGFLRIREEVRVKVTVNKGFVKESKVRIQDNK